MHWFYKPLLERYLRKERFFYYDELKVQVRKGVFHPAFFGSSLVFYHFLKKQALKNKSLLEVGCGSGFLSLISAKHGAKVKAIDINPTAIDCTRLNAQENGLAIDVLESNLFANLEAQVFDIIILNPPYFEGSPNSAGAYAWYTGKEHQFFHTFFQELADYIHNNTRIWMILSEVCELARIDEIANKYQFKMQGIFQQTKQFEKFIIFEVKSKSC